MASESTRTEGKCRSSGAALRSWCSKLGLAVSSALPFAAVGLAEPAAAVPDDGFRETTLDSSNDGFTLASEASQLGTSDVASPPLLDLPPFRPDGVPTDFDWSFSTPQIETADASIPATLDPQPAALSSERSSSMEPLPAEVSQAESGLGVLGPILFASVAPAQADSLPPLA